MSLPSRIQVARPATGDDFAFVPSSVDACCAAGKALTAQPGRIRRLCPYTWLTKVA